MGDSNQQRSNGIRLLSGIWGYPYAISQKGRVSRHAIDQSIHSCVRPVDTVLFPPTVLSYFRQSCIQAPTGATVQSVRSVSHWFSTSFITLRNAASFHMSCHVMSNHVMSRPFSPQEQLSSYWTAFHGTLYQALQSAYKNQGCLNTGQKYFVEYFLGSDMIHIKVVEKIKTHTATQNRPPSTPA